MTDNNDNETIRVPETHDTLLSSTGSAFCIHCGGSIPQGVAFCPLCGKPQSVAQSPAQPQAVPSQQAASPQQVYYAQPQPAYAAAAMQQPQVAVQNITNTTVTQHPSNNMGIAGFVLALMALVLIWVPVLDLVLWFLGLLFSVIGLFKAPRGLAVAGFIISIFSIVLAVTALSAVVGLAER